MAVQWLSKKASQNINAFSRVVSFMNFKQRRQIINVFVTSHFSYCTIFWMIHSRKLNDLTEKGQERVLRASDRDHKSTFRELLSKDKSLTIHHVIQKQLFFKIGVRKNFVNFTRKHLFWSLQHRCFPVKFAKFLRTPFFIEHLGWLLLNSISSRVKSMEPSAKWRRKASIKISIKG